MFDELLGKSGFSLERLRALCDVAEKGSIGEATQRNPNRQSLYSRQIKELEVFFQTDLLNRDSRPHKLTEEGAELVKLTRGYMGQLTDFTARCQNRPENLTIGTGESTIQWLLLPDLEKWQKQMPNASIHLKNLRTMDVVEELNDGEIDLGLIRKTALANNSSLEHMGSVKFSYRLFVPRKMRRKYQTKIGIAEFEDCPLAVVDGNGEFRTSLAALAKEAGIGLNIRLELSSLTQIANAIQSGNYAGFLPQFAQSIVGEKANIHEVKGFDKLDRELVFVWNPKKLKMRPIIEKALELVKREFVKTGEIRAAK